MKNSVVLSVILQLLFSGLFFNAAAQEETATNRQEWEGVDQAGRNRVYEYDFDISEKEKLDSKYLINKIDGNNLYDQVFTKLKIDYPEVRFFIRKVKYIGNSTNIGSEQLTGFRGRFNEKTKTIDGKYYQMEHHREGPGYKVFHGAVSLFNEDAYQYRKAFNGKSLGKALPNPDFKQPDIKNPAGYYQGNNNDIFTTVDKYQDPLEGKWSCRVADARTGFHDYVHDELNKTTLFENKQTWGDESYANELPALEPVRFFLNATCYEDEPEASDNINKELIRLETNPATGESFEGIVADQSGKLKIIIDPRGKQLKQLKLKQTRLGHLVTDDLEQVNDSVYLIPLDQNVTELVYIPPFYLKDEMLDLMHSESGIWYTETPLQFKLYFNDGDEQVKKFNLRLYRPPVLLVHGFTGSKATWEEFDNFLHNRKYDTYRGEYYALDESIPAQSRLLKSHISEKKSQYTDNNVKIAKVDIVAHSMGGLISRFYIEKAPYYTGNVRKLIMVGTPNHGVSLGRFLAGFVFSKKGENKHEIAAQQLFHYSDFIIQMNSLEEEGRHLNMDVQYGNIFSHDLLLLAGDGVVASASAYLNGVENKRYEGYIHSVDVPVPGSYPAITHDETIYKNVISWLGHDLKKQQLDDTQIRLIYTEEKAEIWELQMDGNELTDKHVAVVSEADIPFLLNREQLVTTSNGRAVLDVAINNEQFGRVLLDSATTIQLGFISPELIEVRMFKGNARFKSYPDQYGLGHFTIDIEARGFDEQRFTGLGTDFSVCLKDGEIEMFCYEGRVAVMPDDPGQPDMMKKAGGEEGFLIATDGALERTTNPPAINWEDDYLDVQIKKDDPVSGNEKQDHDQESGKPENNWKELISDDVLLYGFLG
ncbi:MAG: alpha/beta fold hydrolase, partial [Bacteroidales bacterium]|nr:alpha/beta fold hydrolase [Bacteroidales bacterium]